MATANERILNEQIAHQIDLQRYGNNVVRRFISLLNKVDSDLFAQLMAALDRMPADSFTVERLDGLLTSVAELNAAAYRRAGDDLAAQLMELAAYEVGFQSKLLLSVLPAQVSVAAVVADQVYTAAMSRPFQGRLLREWSASIQADRMTRIRDAVRIGYVESQTVQQIVQRIRGTRAKAYADGIIEIDRRNAEAVVRTALGHMAGAARDQVYDANGDIIAALKWTATLDSRTSEGCRIRDQKTYTPDTHKPIGHSIPWLGGPGRLHWNAVAAGTMIATRRGAVPVESVTTADYVLTHEGRWRPVLACRAKPCESGVVRVVHTQAGRVLRATDDHPVLTANGWQFVGALEAGDCLLGDVESLCEVGDVGSLIHSESEDGPAISDEYGIALARTLQLVAPDIDFESNPQVGAREVEDRITGLVLREPLSVLIKQDQSSLHHLLALAHALQKLGSHGLRDFLADFCWDGSPAHQGSHSATEVCGGLGCERGISYASNVHRVAGCHSCGVQAVGARGLLCLTEGPMVGAGRCLPISASEVVPDLLGARAHSEVVADRVAGKAPVRQILGALDVAQRTTSGDVLLDDECFKSRVRFAHDKIVALELQTHSGMVYDLEVGEDASYVAGGLVVSNCRSVSTPVLKSWRELGIPIDEFTPSTRASLDGQVPAEMSYGEWLKKQSAARQDDVLGPTRGKLFREGGLSMDRFYNDKGRFLTIDEMRSRDAAAFRRAGL